MHDINQSSDIDAPILSINKSIISHNKNKDIINFIKHIAIDSVNIVISKIFDIIRSINDKLLKSATVK